MTDKDEKEITSNATDIAQWLFSKIQEIAPQQYAQQKAVMYIRTTYGEEWSYRNKNGNWAIKESILTEFGKLKATDPNVRWNRGSQTWSRVSDERLQYLLAQEERQREARAARKAKS